MTVSVTTGPQSRARESALREVGVDGIEDEHVGDPRVLPGDPERARLVAQRHEHPVGRPLEGLAADDPGDGDDRDATGAGCLESGLDARRPPRIGRTETNGFDGAMTIAVGGLERRLDLGRRGRVLDAANRRSRTSGSWCRRTK